LRFPRQNFPKVTASIRDMNESLFCEDIGAVWLRAGVGHRVALPVKAADKHRATMALAFWLSIFQDRSIIPLRHHVSETLAETPPAVLLRTPKELNRIIRAERCDTKLHCAKVTVAEWKNVGPHRLARV
jgi:hypothetical protein